MSFWKVSHSIIFALICTLFVLGIEPYALTQSKISLEENLSKTSFLQNMAILITLETILDITFSFIALKLVYRKHKRWFEVFLQYYPGLLIFPALYYLLAQSLFTFTGIDFDYITYLTGAGTLVLIPLSGKVIKQLLPEKEFRLESYFLVSLVLSIIGLFTTVSQEFSETSYQAPLNLKELSLCGLISVGILIAGAVWNHYKWIILQFKNK